MAGNNIKKYQIYGSKISLEDLKTFLWDAAVHLRGQIDAAGYKEYIFPLLFFKRISDVYDEQYGNYVQEGGEDYANAQVQELAIRIPDGAHWQDVRKVTQDVGQALVAAFIAIEQANPARNEDGRKIGGLEGIFGPKDGWTNKNKMPDYIITSLIENFSRYTLSLEACPADEMGQAYEYLVGKFADDAGNTAQEFYTNRTVVELMAEILQPKPDESIYDPTCGSGGMLVKSLDYLRNKGEEWKGVKVFGQEINGLTSSIARMNLYLNGVTDFSIACGDTLTQPAFLDGSQLRKFDVVLANPPYSIKEWNRTAFMNDKWGRNFLGTPIQARADYAFIQHIIASMSKINGRCAILLPHGVLNREEDREIRLKHVLSDTIDAIIGLGRNLFYNSGLESFILVCRNTKPQTRKRKIIFIEAEKLTHKKGKQSYLYPDDISKILKAYNSDNDIEGLSKIVDIDNVISNGGNLNIKFYVKPLLSNNEISLKSSLQCLYDNQLSLHDAFNSFSLLPQTEMWGNIFINDKAFIKPSKTRWKKVKLADVAEEYSVRIDNPSQSEYDYFIGSDCISQYDFMILKRSSASTITSAQKAFKNGDYLLVRRSLYGSDFRERAPRADFDGVCSADILTIREKTGILYNGFLIFVLYQKPLWDFIVSNSNGGLTRRIKWKQLADFSFDLPPYEEQKIIADKLWAAYHLKESYKKLLAATDDMVKSQFIEMFGNPFMGYNKWPYKRLCDCCVINPQRPKGIKDETMVSFVPMQDVPDDGSEKIYTTRPYSEVKKGFTYCADGDVLFAKITPCMENGKGIELSGLSNGIGFGSTEFHVLRSMNRITNPTWIYNLTKLDIFRKDAAKNMTGTGGQKRVPVSYLENFMIELPPIDLQCHFAAIAQQADKSKSIYLSKVA